MADRDWDLVKGVIIGGLIGAALGLLFAPKSGKETREDLVRKTDEVLAKAKEEYEKAAEKSKAFYESATMRLKEASVIAGEKVHDLEQKVGELKQQSAETIAENKNRLKKAVDAGIGAYREEKEKFQG